MISECQYAYKTYLDLYFINKSSGNQLILKRIMMILIFIIFWLIIIYTEYHHLLLGIFINLLNFFFIL